MITSIPISPLFARVFHQDGYSQIVAALLPYLHNRFMHIVRENMAEKYQALVRHLRDITNLNHASGVLEWDQQTQMPPGGEEARASQLATLARLSHEMFASDTTARLLEDAAAELDGVPYDSDEASMVRVTQLDYEEAIKLPAEYVGAVSEATSLAHAVWAKARQDNHFQSFQGALQKIIDLMIQGADYLGYPDQPYDNDTS
jgi:carboxypeptidase Taq